MVEKLEIQNLNLLKKEVIKLAFYVVVMIVSVIVSGFLADNIKKNKKEIDKAVEELKKHERHQDYLERKRRIQRGK